MAFLAHCSAQPGTLSARIVSNALIDLPPTLYYDLVIPLAPFMPADADLIATLEEVGGVDLPIETQFSLEFIKLPETDWRRLDGRTFEPDEDDQDGSIYLLSAHHPVIVERLHFVREAGVRFRVNCTLLCDYVDLELGEPEILTLETAVTFAGLSVNLTLPDATHESVRAALRDLVSLDAYRPEPRRRAASLFEFAPLVE